MNASSFLATGVTALLLGACASDTSTPAPAATKTATAALVKCEGINTCKGTSECKSADGKSDCQGLNSCAGQGFISVPEAECTEKKGKVIK